MSTIGKFEAGTNTKWHGAGISKIHTLGPTGTNCEAAAYYWASRQGLTATVELHATLEIAAEAMLQDEKSVLLGCIVYPQLHLLVFSNLTRFRLVDVFIMNTHSMVLAARTAITPRLVSTHPAPALLIPPKCESRLVSSNAQAARDCSVGISDGCITTSVAAARYHLTIIQDYGEVPMGFCLHQAWR